MDRKVKYILNPSELTAGTRGSSLGPGAILTAARTLKSTYFGKFDCIEIPSLNRALDFPSSTPFAHYVHAVVESAQRLEHVLVEELNQGVFPVILAGDHGSAAGTITAIQAANPNKRLGVVWIDAHADIHSPFTTPSGNMHGMPLAVALNLDHQHLKKNTPSQEVIDAWNKLKKIDTARKAILPEDLVYVAVRDTEPEEDIILKELSIKNFTVQQVRTEGPDWCAAEIKKQLSACDIIYISFDVDSMDPDVVSYGTGTPVKNGLFPDECLTLLQDLMQSPKICCLEVVEVNPCLDNLKNTMAHTTFALLQQLIPAVD